MTTVDSKFSPALIFEENLFLAKGYLLEAKNSPKNWKCIVCVSFLYQTSWFSQFSLISWPSCFRNKMFDNVDRWTNGKVIWKLLPHKQTYGSNEQKTVYWNMPLINCIMSFGHHQKYQPETQL